MLPASGFQSAQYRKIEICSTDFFNLVDKEVRPTLKDKNPSIEEMFQNIYWNKGATELSTGKKNINAFTIRKKIRKGIYSIRKRVVIYLVSTLLMSRNLI